MEPTAIQIVEQKFGAVLERVVIKDDEGVKLELVKTKGETWMFVLFKDTGQEAMFPSGTILLWFWQAFKGRLPAEPGHHDCCGAHSHE